MRPFCNGYGLPDQIVIPVGEGTPTEGGNRPKRVTARHSIMAVTPRRCIDSIHSPAREVNSYIRCLHPQIHIYDDAQTQEPLCSSESLLLG